MDRDQTQEQTDILGNGMIIGKMSKLRSSLLVQHSCSHISANFVPVRMHHAQSLPPCSCWSFRPRGPDFMGREMLPTHSTVGAVV